MVIQEIFGVNSHIKAVADGYAADGYLVIAPAMFDRVQRGYDTGYTQPEIQAGVAIMQKLDWKQTMLDVDAAIAAAKPGGQGGHRRLLLGRNGVLGRRRTHRGPRLLRTLLRRRHARIHRR